MVGRRLDLSCLCRPAAPRMPAVHRIARIMMPPRIRNMYPGWLDNDRLKGELPGGELEDDVVPGG